MRGRAGRGGGLAARLIDDGADRVLAMQTSVTDAYATRLAGEFYREPAFDPTATPAAALADTRRRLEEERLERVRAGGPAPGRSDFGVATLLAAGADAPLVDVTAAPGPLAQPYAAPAGGPCVH